MIETTLNPTPVGLYALRKMYSMFHTPISGVCGVRDMLRLCKGEFYNGFDSKRGRVPNLPPIIYFSLKNAGLSEHEAQEVSNAAKLVADKKASNIAKRSDIPNAMRVFCTELAWFYMYDAILSNLQHQLSNNRSLFGNEAKLINRARDIYEDKRFKLGIVIQRAIKQARLTGKIAKPCFAVDIIWNHEAWQKCSLSRNTIINSCKKAIEIVQADIESMVAYEQVMQEQLPNDLFELLVVFLFRDYFLSLLENSL